MFSNRTQQCGTEVEQECKWGEPGQRVRAESSIESFGKPLHTQCNNQSKECWQYIWESRRKKYTFLCHLQDPKKFHRRLLGIFIQTKPVFMASALERIPGLIVELKILSKIYFNIYLCICLHELCMCTTIVLGALEIGRCWIPRSCSYIQMVDKHVM